MVDGRRWTGDRGMVNGEWVMDHGLRPNVMSAIEAERAGGLAVSVRRGQGSLRECLPGRTPTLCVLREVRCAGEDPAPAETLQ